MTQPKAKDPATQRFVVAEDDLVFLKPAEKFDEADWVRNSGRFARYVGQGPQGGGGGRSSGAGTEDDPLRFEPAYIGGGLALQQELVPHFSGWAAKVTPEERQALIRYASDSYPVNTLLRHPEHSRSRPDPRGLIAERRAETEARIALMDSALAKASSPEMVVYRGLGFEGSRTSLAPGDMFADRAFISTSVNPVNAADFGTVVEIRVPRGSRAVAINAVINPSGTEHVPGTRNEAEVLIDRGAAFRVTGSREQAVTYAVPAGGTETKRLHILEVEMMADAGDIPQLGEKALGDRASYRHMAWGDDDIVMLVDAVNEARKFNEADWVRNSGRFADFTGSRRGGAGGGAGAATAGDTGTRVPTRAEIAIARQQGTGAPLDAVQPERVPTADTLAWAAIIKRQEAENTVAGPKAKAAAAAAHEKAVRAEKEISPQVQEIVTRVDEGSQTVGWSFRLKEEGSMARKLEKDAKKKGVDPAKAAPGMKDNIRYTVTFPADSYTRKANETMQAFKDKGYTMHEPADNFWRDGNGSYKGINTVMRAPNGHLIEVQYHTPASYDAKSRNHDLYGVSRARTGVVPPTIVEDANAVMTSRFANVPAPRGVDSIR